MSPPPKATKPAAAPKTTKVVKAKATASAKAKAKTKAPKGAAGTTSAAARPKPSPSSVEAVSYDPTRSGCTPCHGTGRLVSGLGGSPHEVTCMWCGGSGRFQLGRDAQAAAVELAAAESAPST